MTRYGAPERVVFCRKCTASNQRPSSVVEWNSDGTTRDTLGMNADGVCAACEYAEIKATKIDWGAREDRLRDLCSQYRSKAGHADVLVPGSGGKDSTFAAHVLKERFGMHPLTVTWSPHMWTDVGWRNFQRWTAIADNVLVTPNRRVHRLLTRLSFLKRTHPFASFVIGQRLVAPRLSVKLGIPFCAYGDAPSEYAGPVEENFTPTMDRKFYSGAARVDSLQLAGCTGAELMSEHGLTEGDLAPYMPVDSDELCRTGTVVHYLGYYLRWDSQEAYYYAREHCGFECNDERTEGSYSKYSSIDDRIDPLHYFTTLAKFGIGRATYDSAQEIRNGKITRDEGVALVRRYDTEFPQRYFAECLEYMGIDEATFWQTIDNARPEHLWERDERGDWQLKHAVWQ